VNEVECEWDNDIDGIGEAHKKGIADAGNGREVFGLERIAVAKGGSST